MTDNLSKKHRSWNMSRIKGRDTKPELAVRSTLHRLGFRFRLHRSDLPGRPDIVLPKLKTVIFVHGCFWHRHRHCRFSYIPKTRVSFWEHKFQQNMARDSRNQLLLRALGWRVMIVWECATRNKAQLSRLLSTQFRPSLQSKGTVEA